MEGSLTINILEKIGPLAGKSGRILQLYMKAKPLFGWSGMNGPSQ